MSKKCVLIRENGMAEVMNFPEADKLEWHYEQIRCRCIDIVRPYGLMKLFEEAGLKEASEYSLVVDDEALLKDQPEINIIGSLLYGADEHGQPLCGTVLIAKDEMTDDGIDTVGLEDGEVKILFAAINELIAEHNEMVKKMRNGSQEEN